VNQEIKFNFNKIYSFRFLSLFLFRETDKVK
jgi:hypothetical protein